jgi:hypothetical protein
MASAREIQYIIKARDEATAIFKKMGQEGSQAAKDVAKAFDIATTASSKHEKQSSRLTKWISEDRKEKRAHNYLYREGAEIMGAASLAMVLFGNTIGQTNEKTKKLTNSLNAGFVGFQGISSALFMLPGPIGLVAGAIGGLAILFRHLTDNAAENAAALKLVKDETKAYYEGINLENTTKALKLNEAVLSAAQKRLESLKTETTINEKTIYTGTGVAVVKERIVKATDKEIEYAQMTVDSYSNVVGVLREQKIALEQVEAVENRRNAQKKGKDSGLGIDVTAMTTDSATIKRHINDLTKTKSKAFNADKALAEVNEKVYYAGLRQQKALTDAQEKETEARIASMEMEILAAAASYDSSESLGKQIYATARESIKAYAAQAVAAQLKSVFETLPFPLNLISAAAAGVATSALFDQLVPKFARGTPRGGFLVPDGHENDTFPILVSSHERVHVTPANQATNNSATVVININAPGTPVKLVRDAVIEGLRRTGMKVDRYFIDNSNKLNLASA